MKTIADRVSIGFGAKDHEGSKLDPEEQPVVRSIDTEAQVTGTGLVIPATVTTEMNAAEAEALFTTQCRFCAHWRKDEFQRDKRNMSPIDLDRMRAQVLDFAELDEIDLTTEQRDLADPLLDGTMGKCMALSAVYEIEPVYSHEAAGCPERLPNGIEVRGFFKPIPSARKVQSQIRDRIMRRAQGKIA